MNINVESMLSDSLTETTLGTIVANSNRPSQNVGGAGPIGMKTDRIRTDITDITFVFIFLSRFGFEYGYCQPCQIGYNWMSTS